jgi:drug/metabolite transporter (DMT)-like permease
LCAIGIYAGMFAVGRAGAASGLDGFDQTALRFGTSALLVLPWMPRLGLVLKQQGPWRCVLLISLGGALYSVVFLTGLVYAPVAYGAAIVPTTQPAAVMLLGWLLQGQAVGRMALLGWGVCVSGLLLVLAGNPMVWPPGFAQGCVLFVVAGCMWGTYTYLLRQFQLAAFDALLLFAFGSALLFVIPYGVIRGGGLMSAPPSAIALQIAYQGVLVGVVATVAYARAVQGLGAARVALLSPFIPVLATLVSWFALGESLPPLAWTGIGLVTLGLLLGQTSSMSGLSVFSKSARTPS